MVCEWSALGISPCDHRTWEFQQIFNAAASGIRSGEPCVRAIRRGFEVSVHSWRGARGGVAAMQVFRIRDGDRKRDRAPARSHEKPACARGTGGFGNESGNQAGAGSPPRLFIPPRLRKTRLSFSRSSSWRPSFSPVSPQRRPRRSLQRRAPRSSLLPRPGGPPTR